MDVSEYSRKVILDAMGIKEHESAQMVPVAYVKRLENAREWSIKLAAMLEIPAKKDTPARLWRTRFFADDNYLIVTLIQNFRPRTGPNGQQEPAIVVWVTRGYDHTTMGSGSSVQMSLLGQYSPDELVAFLKLDRHAPDSIEWKDETRYTDIALPTSDLVHQLARRVD